MGRINRQHQGVVMTKKKGKAASRTPNLAMEIARPTRIGARQPWAEHPAIDMTPPRLWRLMLRAEQGDSRAWFDLCEDVEERDLHYQAVLGVRKRQVAQLPISVEAASDDAEHQAHADLIREFLRRDELQADTVALLDALGKGVSFIELVWPETTGWNLPRLEWRDPRFFEFDWQDGGCEKLRGDGGQLIALEPRKFIVHKHYAKQGHAIRGGHGRGVAWMALFKTFGVRDWVSWLQCFGRPVRVGKYHQSATDSEKTILLRALHNIAGDLAAMIPEAMAIEFIEAKGGAAVDAHMKLCDWIDRQISKAVLGQTATTDAIAGGHAVGREHNDVRSDIEAADAAALAATLNQQLVRPIIDLNFAAPSDGAYPRIVIGRDRDLDWSQLWSAVDRGMQVEESVIRDKLGLPDPPKSGEPVRLLGQKSSQAALSRLVALAERSGRPLADEARQGALSDAAIEAVWQPVEDDVAALIARISGAATPQDALAVLNSWAAGQPPEELQVALAMAVAAGRGLGDAG
jgi:phage gp29-like protein